jgi:hypothetical protein
MIIVIDYDNDAIRMTSDQDDFIATHRITGNINEYEKVISDILELISDEHLYVELKKQSDGKVTSIRSY